MGSYDDPPVDSPYRRALARIVELEEENERWKAEQKEDQEAITAINKYRAEGIKRYQQAEAENERLKVCGNCATFRMWPDYFPHCDVLDREYDAEDVGGRWPDPSGKCVCPGESRWAERETK